MRGGRGRERETTPGRLHTVSGEPDAGLELMIWAKIKSWRSKVLPYHMPWELSGKRYPKVLILFFEGWAYKHFISSSCFSVSFPPWYFNGHILLSEWENLKNNERNFIWKNGCYISSMSHIIKLGDSSQNGRASCSNRLTAMSSDMWRF